MIFIRVPEQTQIGIEAVNTMLYLSDCGRLV